jgi:hypothetical protein
MMLEHKYDEVVGEQPKVPVTLRNSKLTQGDADLISDILSLRTV